MRTAKQIATTRRLARFRSRLLAELIGEYPGIEPKYKFSLNDYSQLVLRSSADAQRQIAIGHSQQAGLAAQREGYARMGCGRLI